MNVLETDVAVIGGGMIGAATAYGMARRGVDTVMLDEGDMAFRAARGNFGLVWVQSKGFGLPIYLNWSCDSANLWESFGKTLVEETGIDVEHERKGGLVFCYSEKEFVERAKDLQSLSETLKGKFTFEMVDRNALRGIYPSVGETVAGASYCPQDGVANPLLLLRALHVGYQRHGGRYLPDNKVLSIEPTSKGFTLRTSTMQVTANKVLLAAGLANAKLAPQVGLYQPVSPERGQVLVTEKCQPCMALPMMLGRQMKSGTIMLGWSAEDVGFDERTSKPVMKNIAETAVKSFPFLRNVRLIRTWGALRILTADGMPIYEQSKDCPGAFAATAHSGVTLAGAHATDLASWIIAGSIPEEMNIFSSERFKIEADKQEQKLSA